MLKNVIEMVILSELNYLVGKMKRKGTVPNIMWIIIGIVIILAFAIIFWLISKGWLLGGANIVEILSGEAQEKAEGIELLTRLLPRV